VNAEVKKPLIPAGVTAWLIASWLTSKPRARFTRIFAYFSPFRVDFCISKIRLNMQATSELTILDVFKNAAKIGRAAPYTIQFNELHQNRRPSQNFKAHLLYCFNLKGQLEAVGKPGKMG
jgi:hypothetical protein